MYPLKLDPIYKEMIWGGNKIKTIYNKEIPSDKTGESWNIACRDKEMCVINNGEYNGKLFIDVLNMDREGYLGKRLYNEPTFPLLIKIIDAQDNLSVQVHPNDEYAMKLENYIYGKTEMWYILDALEDAYLIIGLKENTTKEQFRQAVENGNVEDFLGKLYVKKGDVINIPSGLVHAITSGVMLAEIQQNSDITYRVYDYNRVGNDGKPRELHVEKAIEVIDFKGEIKTDKVPGLSVKKGNNEIIYYIADKYFAVEKFIIKDSLVCHTDGLKFETFTCVFGQCDIISSDNKVTLNNGESIFIPAGLGEYKIVGDCELLKGYVPVIQDDFINPLLENGYTLEEIKEKTYIAI